MRSLALFFLFSLITACSGRLWLTEEDDGASCQATGTCENFPCTPSNPVGRCPVGQTCVTGQCFTEVVACCTDCSVDEGCRDCTCVPLIGEAPCSVDHPDGLCPGGEVCAGGQCAPPGCGEGVSGCCAHGTACYGGACVLISERPCADHPDDGLCPAGQACAQGSCVAMPCGSGAACGGCAEGSSCVEGACIPLACSPLHLDGACAEGLRCTDCGECADASKCCSTADCTELGYGKCGVAGACLGPDQCTVDGDCTGGEHCCATGECIGANACCVDGDCLAGFVCEGGVCLPELTGCTTNERVANDGGLCAVDQLFCCPAGETCCDVGKTCNTRTGVCIDIGRCVDPEDCAPGFTCSSVTNVCEPIETCVGGCDGGVCQGTCDSLEVCSVLGGCMPAGGCASDFDCPVGARCNSAFACEIDCSCGCAPFDFSKVPPNVLTLLDRSTSMTINVPGTNPQPRWDVAIDAVSTMATAFDGEIRFGLGTFPASCAGNACDENCPGTNACTSSPNCVAGGVNVPVGDDQKAAIDAYLQNDCPGGFTPTAPTLHNIYLTRGDAGLDDTDRTNSIVLVTDGEANCYPACGSTVDQAAQYVYDALDELRTAEPPVRTYIVGFGVRAPRLNCYAVHGGTSRCSTDDVACGARTSDKLCRNEACEWSGFNCVGSVKICTTFADSTSCGNAGCRWVGGACVPDHVACNTLPNEEECERRCAWRSQSSCTGNNGVCGTRDAASCATTCSWASSCSGNDALCATYANSTTCTNNGCAWTGTSCTGIDDQCDDRSGSANCRALCDWTGAACTGDDTACSAYSSSSSCDSAGCSWVSSCSGAAPECSGFTSSGSCRRDCTWTGAACTGDDAQCSTYASSTACTNGGCSWGGVCSGVPAACGTPPFQSSAACLRQCTWTGSACTGDDSTCSSYGNSTSCTNGGCAWVNSCTGDDGACGVFGNATDCGNNGCTWNGSACVGDDTACSPSGSSGACALRCEWNGATCVGDDSACGAYSSSGTCASNGCVWTTEGVCVGDNTGCAANPTAARCEARCAWAGSCTGDDSNCAGRAESACDVTCGWANVCTGDDSGCSGFTQAACEADCTWSSSCTGNDGACAPHTTQAACEPRCAWAASCGGAAGCSARASQTSCLAACDWNGTACVGDDACATQTGSTACGNAGCVWQSANVCVGVNEVTCVDAGTCYYLALDADSLAESLSDIGGEVASCTFALSGAVPDWSRVYVYLTYASAADVPPECAGRNPCSLGPADGEDWIANPAAGAVDIRGAACDAIKNGKATPFIAYGCPDEGG